LVSSLITIHNLLHLWSQAQDSEDSLQHTC